MDAERYNKLATKWVKLTPKGGLTGGGLIVVRHEKGPSVKKDLFVSLDVLYTLKLGSCKCNTSREKRRYVQSENNLLFLVIFNNQGFPLFVPLAEVPSD